MYEPPNIVTRGNCRPRSARKAHGFTLFEVTVATALAVIVTLSGLTIYTYGISWASRSVAKVAAAESASNAVNHVCQDTRAAYAFALPSDAAGFTAPLSYTASQFETTVNGNLIDTGIELEFGSPIGISVLNSSGHVIAVANPPDNQSDAANLWFYRSDGDGTPDASAGKFLWIYGSENGVSVNKPLAVLFDEAPSAAAEPAAVAISRPLDNGSPQAALPYQVRYQIMSGYFSLAGGTQTNVNDSSQSFDESVLLRNHG